MNEVLNIVFYIFEEGICTSASPFFVFVCKESCLLVGCGVVMFNSFWITDNAVMAVLRPVVQSDMSVFIFCSE